MKREGGGVSQRHQNLSHQQEAYLPSNSRFFHAVFLFIPDVNGINAIFWVPSSPYHHLQKILIILLSGWPVVQNLPTDDKSTLPYLLCWRNVCRGSPWFVFVGQVLLVRPWKLSSLDLWCYLICCVTLAAICASSKETPQWPTIYCFKDIAAFLLVEFFFYSISRFVKHSSSPFSRSK